MINTLLISVLSWCCKHVNKFAYGFGAIFVVGLLLMQYTNKIDLERQAATIDNLTTKLQERNSLIDEMKSDIKVSREIAEKHFNIAKEQRGRRDEQLNKIQNALKTSRCATTRLPDDVINELHK